jgi:hypothetical protein
MLKISMYLFISLVYIFHEKLGHNTYKLLGGLYFTVFILSVLLYIKKQKKHGH